jgi:hypothetical protein
MFEHKKIEKLDDYFIDLGKRREKGVYFYRINGCNPQIREFIQKYYETARLGGVIIEGKLQNPDEKNLSYYNEIMGMDFKLSMEFILTSLQKWLPRMNGYQRQNVAASIYDTLNGLRQIGKNENMLKNAYIKFMCWLYYKFERIVNRLGEEKLPKILYEGSISNYELLLLSVLSNAGCDIVLLQYHGDADYRKVDPDSSKSDDLQLPQMKMDNFPEGFCLKSLREDIQNTFNRERLYGTKSCFQNCTNAWISGNLFEDIKKAAALRGSAENFYYNCFCQMTGVEDRMTYLNDLYRLQSDLKNAGRRLVIVNQTLPPPTTEEISQITRHSYQKYDQMILDLSANIRGGASQELLRLQHTAFTDICLEESKKEGMNVNKLTNKAVYLLCWLKRYQAQLFGGWKFPEISCFFFYGGCQNENEAIFARFLARLPVDVVIFHPDLNQRSVLSDKMLYEIHYPYSLISDQYPERNPGTVAYHAERELDTLLYQDTGIYRDQQYGKANSVTLQTMYEEISVLWDQELKYRPNFGTANDSVNMPVIFSKISGIKDGITTNYWNSIKTLLTADTEVIREIPHITSVTENPVKPFAVEFLKNKKLQKSKIKGHKSYPYGFLRETMQDHILDKIQMLIDQRLIRGTFENGTEYTIVSVGLNIEKMLLRQIQKFDFTKKNPKLIYIITGEKALSLEDTIYAALLNLIGFDILFFVPTGYQCIERFFARPVVEEHQIGTYVYDLQIPDFQSLSSATGKSWFDRFFKRGT